MSSGRGPKAVDIWRSIARHARQYGYDDWSTKQAACDVMDGWCCRGDAGEERLVKAGLVERWPGTKSWLLTDRGVAMLKTKYPEIGERHVIFARKQTIAAERRWFAGLCFVALATASQDA